jgi:eukaryotic-like serine/threonine-protein kinase
VRVVMSATSGWVFITAAVLATVAGALARVWLPGAFASGAGAAVALAAGVWAARGTSALQAGDEQHRALAGGVWLMRSGRLPLVRELRDPVLLGVHPAAEISGRDRNPAFVPRDVSGRLAGLLRRDRFVLLVGESTAGKSRAGYELIRTELPDYRVVQPLRRETAAAAAGLAAATRRSVLWLDDLERFLGSGGLTGAAVRSVLEAAGGARFIVATMRAEEYAKFSGRIGVGAEGVSREVLREGWDVLRLAARVEVPRTWSAAEIARAAHRHDDQRLVEAVRHAGEFGIAEYLAAAPQLLAEWRDAWAPSMHPRAAALVLAAVDARRAGVHRPLPPQVLLRMHEPYLLARGGQRLRPEPVNAALEWAGTPLYATSSLLLPAADGFLAFDYLIDAADKDLVPPQALDALIAFSTPQESLDIGELAWRWSLTDQAEIAFRRAEAGGLFSASVRRCHLIREDKAGHAAALRFAKDAATWTESVHGPDHEQTLDALKLVAWETGHSGDPAAARQQLERLADRAGQLLGARHKQTLEMRFGAAEMTGHAGDPSNAVQLYKELAEDCRHWLGDDDALTIGCRDQIASWVRDAGDPQQGARLLRELIADMNGHLGSPADQVFGARYRLAACLTEAGDHETALHDWEQLITEATAANGRLWRDTLTARREHAKCTGRTGDPARAVQLLQALLADAESLSQPESVLLLLIRGALAEWTGNAGNPAQAAQQLRTLINQAAQQRGDRDPRVRNLKHRLSHWTAIADTPPAATPSSRTTAQTLPDPHDPSLELAK